MTQVSRALVLSLSSLPPPPFTNLPLIRVP